MTSRRVSAAWWGLGAAVALMVLAMAVPAATGWYVHVHSFPPLHAEWAPRVGVGTAPAIVLAVLLAQRAVDVADRMAWRWLLVWVFAVGLLWMLALAYVDGEKGVSEILQTPYEYLRTARKVDDLHHTLETYVGRIRQDQPGHWPTHVAGHPPGALAFFVVLVRLGLGAGLPAGLAVTVVAATTAVAVLVTVRTLGAEELARRAAPFVAFGPAAVWQCVSADAVFAAVGAWATACLAVAATRRRATWVPWSVLAGLLYGAAVMMSYGLPLLGVLAVAVLVVARSWRPLVAAAPAALAVVVAFGLAGFGYLEALPAIHDRYWGAVGARRQPAYWMWANYAALAFSAGPLAFAGVARLLSRGRDLLHEPATRVVALLAGAGVTMTVLADLSQMSKAEVERIWLPFAPWLLLSCALLPERWRRRGFVLQLALALLVQHLLLTGW